MRALRLEGQRFGRLLVISKIQEKIGRSRWLCRCDCGKEKIITGYHLTNGHTISCGCAGLEHATKAKLKHGDALYRKKNRLYATWSAMKRRCYNKNCVQYRYYGGKGIRVCKSWHDYSCFKKWALSHGYNDELTIDRIDVNKDYSPSNCRWITSFENIARAHAYSEEKRKQALELLLAGKQKKDICYELNISPITLTKWTRNFGLKVRSPYPEAMKQLLFCMRREGMRTVDILEISGIGESTFHQWLKDYGIS